MFDDDCVGMEYADVITQIECVINSLMKNTTYLDGRYFFT